MSAKKSYDTKVPEDDNTDSGFLSGKLDEPQLSEELDRRDPAGDSDSKNVCESEATDDQQDSGLCVSERLSKLDISDGIYTPIAPIAHEGDEGTKAQQLSPEVVLNLLFGQDDDGDTQLHVASVHGCTKSVSVLIRLCPEPVLMDIRNDFGHTALHLAVMSGNAVVTRMLVRAGASLAVRDLKGETPLHIAVAAKNIDCVQALLAPVKELSPQRNRSAILNQKNYQGQTCVHIAAVNGHVEALQILVYYGADINAREGLAGSTALHLAAMRGDERLAWFLMERCAGVRSDARDFAGRSAKRLARRTGARAAFQHAPDSDSDGDSDSDMYDSDRDSLFDRIRDQINPIDVA